MKIEGKKYQEKVIVPKVWEQIEIDGKKETVLISENVSKYIRGLEQSLLFGVGIELPTKKETDTFLIDYTNKMMKEYNEDEKIIFRGGFRNCYRWLKTKTKENGN